MSKTLSELSKGTWNNSTSYTVGDIVDNSGSSYLCILNHTNHQPPNVTYWQLVASKGDIGQTGPTGATGATGAKGDPGTGLIPSGVQNNLVSIDGSHYTVDSGKAIPTGSVVGTTDTQSLTNKTLTSPTIQTTLKVRDIYDLGNLTGAVTIGPDNGDRQGGVLTGNVTGITLTAPASNKKTVLTLYLGTGTGTFTISWTTSVTWQDGSTWGTTLYTTTASKLNTIVLYFDGTTWWGMVGKFA